MLCLQIQQKEKRYSVDNDVNQTITLHRRGMFGIWSVIRIL